MLRSLAYASIASTTRRTPEFLEIARVSLRNNAALGITGALCFDDRQFFQVLEGDRRKAEAMYERIRADPRHRDVVRLDDGPIDARRFADWAMKFVDGRWLAGGRLRFDHRSLCAADTRVVAALAQELDVY